MSDQKSFVDMMDGVSEYYGKDTSAKVIALYWNALKVYSYEEIQTAVQKHMSDPDEGQYMPRIAHFKKYLEGSKDTQAMTAWSKVDRAVRHVGPNASVCFDDPIINRVLSDMGGWVEMCNSTDSNYPFKSNEFRKRYQGFVSDGGVSEYPRLLTGISDAHNASEGYKRREIKAIGDNSKARLVYKGGADPALTNQMVTGLNKLESN